MNEVKIFAILSTSLLGLVLFVKLLSFIIQLAMAALIVGSVALAMLGAVKGFELIYSSQLKMRKQLAEVKSIEISNQMAENFYLLRANEAVLRNPKVNDWTFVSNMIQNRTTVTEEKHDQLLISEPFPPMTKLSSLFPEWQPKKGELFLGIAAGMKKVIVKVKEAWHIVLAGPTGGGKSNTLSLLLIQLVPFFKVFIVNPHWATVEDDGRDWTAIEQRLSGKPMIKREQYVPFFEQMITELDQRLEWRRNKQFEKYIDNPIFIVIDEYPIIKAAWKEAPDVLARFLRESRKVYIFLIMSSQDLLLSTIGGNSGARECYRTAYGFDGDRTTLDVIVKDFAEKKRTGAIDVVGLGIDGKAILRCKENSQGQTIRVPLVDYIDLFLNEANSEYEMDDMIVDGSLEVERFGQQNMPQEAPETQKVEHSIGLKVPQDSVDHSDHSTDELKKVERPKQQKLDQEQTAKVIHAMFELKAEGKGIKLGTIEKRVKDLGGKVYWAHHDAIESLAKEMNIIIE